MVLRSFNISEEKRSHCSIQCHSFSFVSRVIRFRWWSRKRFVETYRSVRWTLIGCLDVRLYCSSSTWVGPEKESSYRSRFSLRVRNSLIQPHLHRRSRYTAMFALHSTSSVFTSICFRWPCGSSRNSMSTFFPIPSKSMLSWSRNQKQRQCPVVRVCCFALVFPFFSNTTRIWQEKKKRGVKGLKTFIDKVWLLQHRTHPRLCFEPVLRSLRR